MGGLRHGLRFDNSVHAWCCTHGKVLLWLSIEGILCWELIACWLWSLVVVAGVIEVVAGVVAVVAGLVAAVLRGRVLI